MVAGRATCTMGVVILTLQFVHFAKKKVIYRTADNVGELTNLYVTIDAFWV